MLQIPWVPEQEWLERTSLDRNPDEAKWDPVWRVANLYSIKKENGDIVPFTPTLEQRVIIWDILVRGLTNIIIPKARKLGMSTCLMVIAADKIAFEGGTEIALVDKTQQDADKKLENMVKIAVNSLPAEFRSKLVTPKGFDNKSAFGLKRPKAGDDTISKFSAGVSFRGGSPQMLIVSEWGTIQFEDESRSAEIKTGAMVAAKFGIRIIETTWKGGKHGHVWTYVEMAMSMEEDEKMPEDWRLRFFPWYLDKRNVRGGRVERIDEETLRYFEEKEAEIGMTFSDGQKLWYWNEKKELGIYIKRENPTTLVECWDVPIEGAIYADLLAKLQGQGRITDFDYDPELEVDTFWDLGAPSTAGVWYAQRKPLGWDLIDVDMGIDLETPERVSLMNMKGYKFGCHYMPHDGAADQKGGMTYQEELMKAGLANIRIVPRTKDPELGIGKVRQLMPNFRFHATKCKTALERLSLYRRKVDSGKNPTPFIVHDSNSHIADALRTGAEADAAGMLTRQGGRRFDMQGLKELNDKAGLATPEVGEITVQERGAVFTKTDGPESWISILEKPLPSRHYLLSYSSIQGRHTFGVIKTEYPEFKDPYDEEIVTAYLVAASMFDGYIDPDIAAKHIFEASHYFGDCQVVTISDEPDATFKALKSANVDRIWNRRTNQGGKTSRIVGWNADGDFSLQINELSKRVREQQIEVYDANARSQLSAFLRLPDGSDVPSAGNHADWVKILAVAMHCLPSSTPFNPQAIRQKIERRDSFYVQQPKKRNSL